MQIRLIRPEGAHKQQALAFRQSFFDAGETVIHGSELLDRAENFESWLLNVTANTAPETVSPDWVVTDTFLAFDEINNLIGIIDLRHTLNRFLLDFGHCGYSVRPDMRCRGYASEMLRQVCTHARHIGMNALQLSVMRDNEPSVRTIRKNGGEYLRSFVFSGEPADIYGITL
ncbi:MAG: GNAT family N-acetyltransferase [Oscillospiraceae bacterium]|nr:GNAT family N-acetyltransferase [Oscillospiraceae bacterium]